MSLFWNQLIYHPQRCFLVVYRFNQITHSRPTLLVSRFLDSTIFEILSPFFWNWCCTFFVARRRRKKNISKQISKENLSKRLYKKSPSAGNKGVPCSIYDPLSNQQIKEARFLSTTLIERAAKSGGSVRSRTRTQRSIAYALDRNFTLKRMGYDHSILRLSGTRRTGTRRTRLEFRGHPPDKQVTRRTEICRLFWSYSILEPTAGGFFLHFVLQNSNCFYWNRH